MVWELTQDAAAEDKSLLQAHWKEHHSETLTAPGV